MTMREHVDRYVMFRRHLGCKFVGEERMLLDYANHAMARGERFAEVRGMLAWVSGACSAGTMHRRLRTVRNFAIWMHAEDERHEVPPRDGFGREQRRRPVPNLLTVAEIKRVMEAALLLPPAGSITPRTYHCVIGLVAATGLRRSEATSLRLADITPDGLIVGPTKFGKHRLVALHDSTRDALGRYLAIRRRVGAASDHLFILSCGRPVEPDKLTYVFTKLVRQTGLRGGPGEPGPRLHDLRHSFCVRSLEAAIASDRDIVHRHMLALSTYVGHASMLETFWYLEATPPLLGQIAGETERLFVGRASR